jgi:DNA-3-methyladenine glycosylase II
MDADHIIGHLKQCPNLKIVIEQTETPDFTPSGRVYYALLDSIVSQQLSVKAANTIFNRFLSLFPDNYPHPELLLALDADQLRSVGLSYQKAAYLQNVAQFAIEYNMEQRDWAIMSDDEIIQLLIQIKGVGKWTVQMVLMFTLGRPDILPIDDLGIQQAMIRLYQLEETGKALQSKMIILAEPWKPYRTYASRYLWRWKDKVNTTDSKI